MKKFFKYAGLIILGLAGFFSAWSAGAVHGARKYTRAVILPDLAKAQWRQPHGPVKQFEISSRDLSGRQAEILVRVEDPGFYDHKGIDLSTPGGGLTTVTQAIVKKLYFESFKPGIAKIKQSLIARFAVNALIAKDDQLTLFINTVYLGRVGGEPLVGLETAAQTYYGRPLSALIEDQYISLIAMIVMPGTFHILEHPEWNEDRTNRIKALMAGTYRPAGLMDQFYGRLPREIIDHGLPPFSYFGD
jgi:monofunctional biosynthetic peptidoglycan transglycosylase